MTNTNRPVLLSISMKELRLLREAVETHCSTMPGGRVRVPYLELAYRIEGLISQRKREVMLQREPEDDSGLPDYADELLLEQDARRATAGDADWFIAAL